MRMLVVVAALVACRGSASEPQLAATVAACKSDKDMACPRPILYVRSLEASQRYYRDQLGFHIDWTDGDPPDFGAVTRGDAQIFMCQGCQGHPGGWIWIFSPDVDAVHADLVRRGATIKATPENKRWGVREMQVTDLDGNVLRIAGPRR